ncbi:MAG: DUF3489 domain-containing protein [Pseudomonadota bacterium]
MTASRKKTIAASAAKPGKERLKGTSAPSPRQTKKNQLIDLLSEGSGTDAATLGKKLGWQPHTTRAAITGLRKLGMAVLTEKEKGQPTRYRLAPDANLEKAR